MNYHSRPFNSARKAISFTILVVGESCLGKSTFIKSLFAGNFSGAVTPPALYEHRYFPTARERLERTTRIEEQSFEVERRHVATTTAATATPLNTASSSSKLQLTIVDTPGFAESTMELSVSVGPIMERIDEAMFEYFKAESGVNRRQIADRRVHCCLYFVSPFAHSLRPIDIEVMRLLHKKVNLIPLIAKADSLTSRELAAFKASLLQDFDRHNIQIYWPPPPPSPSPPLPPKPSRSRSNSKGVYVGNNNNNNTVEPASQDDDVEFAKRIHKSLPLAVISSNCVIQVPVPSPLQPPPPASHRSGVAGRTPSASGRAGRAAAPLEHSFTMKSVRGRQYPWGVVDIENREHSDFLMIRDLLLKHHLDDLINLTHQLHYEAYRLRMLCQSTADEASSKDHRHKLTRQITAPAGRVNRGSLFPVENEDDVDINDYYQELVKKEQSLQRSNKDESGGLDNSSKCASGKQKEPSEEHPNSTQSADAADEVLRQKNAEIEEMKRKLLEMENRLKQTENTVTSATQQETVQSETSNDDNEDENEKKDEENVTEPI